MPTSVCPECDEEVYVDSELEQGDHVSCDECQADLVVVGLDPIELDLRDDSDDDYTDDDDDYDSGRYD
ncbi:MAG: hypothetical protein AB7F88_18175 [Pyrinomonadaceae bacterium]